MHDAQFDESIIFLLLVFETLRFYSSYYFWTSSNVITPSHNFNRFHTSILTFGVCFLFCPILLTCFIKLSRSMLPSRLSFTLMFFFSLQQLCSSLITKVCSSWLISEFISDRYDFFFCLIYQFFYAYFFPSHCFQKHFDKPITDKKTGPILALPVLIHVSMTMIIAQREIKLDVPEKVI